VSLQPAGHSISPKTTENALIPSLYEGIWLWDRLFCSMPWSSSLCSGCASCSTTPGQAIGPHNISVHPSQPCHPTSAPERPNPWPVSPTRPTATPVNRPLSPAPNHPGPRHRASSPHRDAAVRSTPHAMVVPIPTVPIMADSAWAISVPTVIHTAAPGVSCGAAAVGDTFWRPMAPSGLARV
jgi:hypothetical protein